MVRARISNPELTTVKNEQGSEEAPKNLPSTTLVELKTRRGVPYHHSAARAVRHIKAAAEFIDEVGFCFLFSQANLTLPTLWEAVNGEERKMPKTHHDTYLTYCWEWKDELPATKRVFYGKVLKGKPTFISREFLPYFYAMSDNYGELDDYLELYADGKMSEEGKRIYEFLLENPESSTAKMRKGLKIGKQGYTRFAAAIDELQANLLIVKTGTSDDNRWKYCYVYDVMVRRFPEEVAKARQFSSRAAMEVILKKYLQVNIAASIPDIARLFGWPRDRLTLLAANLVSQGDLAEILVTDARGTEPWLTITGAV